MCLVIEITKNAGFFKQKNSLLLLVMCYSSSFSLSLHGKQFLNSDLISFYTSVIRVNIASKDVI